jgi:Tol biopolymer transport system component
MRLAEATLYTHHLISSVLRRTLEGLAIVVLPATPLAAQGATGAAVEGRVLTRDSLPVEQATVHIVNASNGERWRTTTTGRGHYFIEYLSVGGPYRIEVRAVGYQPAHGSHRVPLTNMPRGADSPTWSPDGEKIAFTSSNSSPDEPELYVMNADGSRVSPLTDGWERHYDPAWSPDGSQIVFSNTSALVLIDANGKHRRQLTSPPGGEWSFHDYGPAWSPDGKWVVFSRIHECDPFNDVGGPPCRPTELRMIAVDGGATALVTNGWDPSWGR